MTFHHFTEYRLLSIVALVIGCIAAGPALAAVWHVDLGATGAGDGTSWQDAFTSVQDALDIATSGGDEIWVAAGLYHPTQQVGGEGERFRTFQLRNGVALYGGFAGVEADLEQRDPQANPTILSGDIGVVDDAADNCYHVFYHPAGSDLDATAILDGFIVEDGNADGLMGDSRRAGGMFNRDASPTIANCVFRNHRTDSSIGDGAAMANYYASPVVINCRFEDNEAKRYGGAVANLYAAHPEFHDCVFTGNRGGFPDSGVGYGGAVYNANNCAPLYVGCLFQANEANFDGGAVFNEGSSGAPVFIDCHFDANAAGLYGGAVCNRSGCHPLFTQCLFTGNAGLVGNAHGGVMYSHASTPTLVNCVLYDNTSGCVGNGIYCYQFSDAVITNCILVGDDVVYAGGSSEPVVTFSCLTQPGYEDPAWHNIGADPLLVDAAGGDFRLQASSPCIDAGNSDALPADVADLDGDGDLDEPLSLDFYGNERCVDDPNVVDTGQGSPAVVDMGLYEHGGGVSAAPPGVDVLHAVVYPNPFNPVTTIRFSCLESSRVDAAVYDGAGRLVRRLAAGEVYGAGRHGITWRGLDDRGQVVASGCYHYVLSVGGRTVRGKVTLLK